MKDKTPDDKCNPFLNPLTVDSEGQKIMQESEERVPPCPSCKSPEICIARGDVKWVRVFMAEHDEYYGHLCGHPLDN